MSADTHTSAIDERRASGVTRRLPGAAPAADLTGDDGSIAFEADSSVAVITRPEPRLRQLMGVCAWAAVLGVIGLTVGIRGFFAELLGEAPSWYEPSMIIVGIVGIGLTVGAFVTVHRRFVPYALLAVSTVALGYAVVLTLTAL